MTKGAVIYEKGSPDVFKWENIDVPDPKFDEVLIKNTAVGVNYIDTYHRRGMPHPWPVPDLPIVLGIEGVGIVEDIGSDIIDFKKGDRVAYALPPHGAYSEKRVYPAKKLIKVYRSFDEIRKDARQYILKQKVISLKDYKRVIGN